VRVLVFLMFASDMLLYPLVRAINDKNNQIMHAIGKYKELNFLYLIRKDSR